jgi:hypothetical protein
MFTEILTYLFSIPRRPVYREAGGAPARPKGELQGEAGDGGEHEVGLHAQDHSLSNWGREV